jgi:hypothetical protein
MLLQPFLVTPLDSICGRKEGLSMIAAAVSLLNETQHVGRRRILEITARQIIIEKKR